MDRFHHLLPPISALLLFLAFPPVGLWFLVFLFLIPWLFYLRNAPPLRAALASYAAGFLLVFTTCYWLGVVTIMGLLTAAFVGGFYYAAFGLLLSLWRWKDLSRPIVSAAFFAGLEFLRSRLFWLSFPWALLPHALYRTPFLLQSASIIGTFGTSFLIAAINAFLTELLVSRKHPTKPITGLSVVVLLLLLPALWTPHLSRPAGPTLLIVQGNIPQDIKELAQKEAHDLARTVADLSTKVMDDHIRLTEEALRKGKADLIIWPETMVPGSLVLQPDRYLRLLLCLSRWNAPLLLGSEHRIRCLPYNSAFLLDQKNGLVISRYDKMVLVPVGEYIPAQSFLPFFVYIVLQMMPYEPEDIKAGERLVIFDVGGRKIFVPICFELSFDNLVGAALEAGADLIVNISNDAWFKDSAELDMAVAQGVLRAIEFRVPVVRCVNAGISCYIAPDGTTTLLKDKKGRTKQIEGTMRIVPHRMVGTTPARYLSEPMGWLLLLAPPVLLLFLILHNLYNRKTGG